MVLSEQELIDGSAFPLGARTASRRLIRGHREAEVLTTPETPGAQNCLIANSNAIQSETASNSMHQPGRSARTQATATMRSRGPALGTSGRIIQPWSLNHQEWQSLLHAQSVVANSPDCSRCTDPVEASVFTWARCGTCEIFANRMPASRCTSCDFTHCITCRLRHHYRRW